MILEEVPRLKCVRRSFISFIVGIFLLIEGAGAQGVATFAAVL